MSDIISIVSLELLKVFGFIIIVLTIVYFLIHYIVKKINCYYPKI